MGMTLLKIRIHSKNQESSTQMIDIFVEDSLFIPLSDLVLIVSLIISLIRHLKPNKTLQLEIIPNDE